METKPRDAQLWKLDSGVTLTTPTPSSFGFLSFPRLFSFPGQKLPGA